MLPLPSTTLPDWETLKRTVYSDDGSLRDIYVLDTTREDWNRWIAFVNARYPVRWEAEGHNGGAPATAINADFIARRWDAGREQLTVLAAVFLGNVQANCHFFVETNIEQDLAPGEIRTPADHEQVLAYLIDLSTALSKEVILTEESAEEAVWFRVNGTCVEYISAPYI
ncbi:hypothetical protein [Hymenobacter metallicola]|uniref:Uncharacterized protein n=1 Tax=Hymenobacter metallicola TaxID=2563114 RepID=A0A4Z0PWX7_9BACT|nr:hypothetical protein [Hymenobacter metallicola]TGE20912.1 hypothetical protein E5K02_25260 [Hymenobacter metallicola]